MATTHTAATDAAIEELQQMALDPTLDQCCRRDLEQQIQAERIKLSLQRDDRVEARQRMAAATLCREDPSSSRVDAAGAAGAARPPADSRAPAQQQPQQQQQQQPGTDAADDGDKHSSSSDRELQRLRQQRMQQLRVESARKQEQRREGLGTLNTVPEGSVLRLCCQEPPGRGLVVLHLAVQGHEPCNTLDECLEEAAAQHRGTFFGRCVVSRNCPLVAQLGLPHGVPALLVAKHGAVLGKAHINQFGGADVWEEEVLSYLRRFKVLSAGSSSSGQQASAQAAAAAGSSDDDDGGSGEGDGEAASEWQTPCEVCGRTYPHEHIRAIYSSTQHQDSSDDEEA